MHHLVIRRKETNKTKQQQKKNDEMAYLSLHYHSNRYID